MPTHHVNGQERVQTQELRSSYAKAIAVTANGRCVVHVQVSRLLYCSCVMLFEKRFFFLQLKVKQNDLDAHSCRYMHSNVVLAYGKLLS